MTNILFVCSGNISRSFLAEVLFRRELEQNPGLNARGRSAGLLAVPGNSADEEMVRTILEMGLPDPPHRARRLDGSDVDWAHRVLAMEHLHLRLLRERFPAASEKAQLLGHFIPGEQGSAEIRDPWGLSREDYRTCSIRIEKAVRGLVEDLISRG